MKNTRIIQAAVFALSALISGGCAERGGDQPLPQNRSIVLNLSGPPEFSAESRAPVDSWNNTPVGVAYAFGTDVFNRSLTVLVSDNAGQYVNTGIEYPDDDTPATFIGYHPAITPSVVGTVTYDLSKGGVDVMVSNPVSGSLNNTIMDQGEKLVFRHVLTRVTFALQCSPGQSYPEPIFGLRATASSAKLLNTAVTFDLATEELTFKISGGVFAGDIEGFVIPSYGASPVIVEMMIQPDVPLSFIVASLTGDRGIGITSDANELWKQLTEKGGKRGEQYFVHLSFSGEIILANNISVIPWAEKKQIASEVWW